MPTPTTVPASAFNWDAVSAISTSVASVVAIVALIFTAVAVWKQKKSHDFTALRQFAIDIRDAVERLLNVDPKDEKFESAFVDYLNLLEVSAAAVNHKLVEKVSREIVKDRLINDIAMMSVNRTYKAHIRTALTSKTTFLELRNFHAQFESEIAQTRKERSELKAAHA